MHKIKITCPDGDGVLTQVELDGERLQGVTFVTFSIGVDRAATVTLRMFADLVIEGEAEVVRQWRQGLPWWRRLPYWMHRA